MGRGTSLGYLPALDKSSASLEMVGWETLADQWCGIASRKSDKGFTVRCKIQSLV